MSTPSEPAGHEPGRKNTAAQSNGSSSSSPAPATPKSKRSAMAIPKAIWAKLGLDGPTLGVMFKGSLAPLIATAAYQSNVWAGWSSSSNYLITIVTFLALPILPRGKFLAHILVMAFGALAMWSLVLLALFCSIRARTDSRNVYDSSGAAVAGVWLFFLVYLNNTLRFLFQPYAIPGIAAGIIINIPLIYAPTFGTWDYAYSFARHILEEIMLAIGLGFAVHWVVVPKTMRSVVFKEMTGFIMTIRKLMKANMAYIESLEAGDMFSRTPTGAPDRPLRKEAKEIKGIIAQLGALHGKLSVDISFAKREIAWGKLGPDDLSGIYGRLRSLMFVVIGLSTLNDVFERLTESFGWHELYDDAALAESTDFSEKDHARAVRDWHEIASMLRSPFRQFSGVIDEGLAHVLVVLQLVPQKAAVRDLEKDGNRPLPGDSGYTEYFAQKLKDLRLKRSVLTAFCNSRGVYLPDDPKYDPDQFKTSLEDIFPEESYRHRFRRQLYTILWLDYLLESSASSVHDFCLFVDAKAESGKLRRGRLIFPGYKRLRKYFLDIFDTKRDRYHSGESGDVGLDTENPGASIYLGAAYHQRKDPEHLAPQTGLEKLGDKLRKIPHFFRSKESTFGFRAAFATMCVAIIGLLRTSHGFSLAYRTFWAQIMISFALTPSAASSLFGFVLRIMGTFSAVVCSFIAWYIVDGDVAGVIVFYWFFLLWGYWFMWKFPTKIMAGMLFCVTMTLIIGYELQIKKLSIPVATRNGQKYFPIYELGPYRLLVVSAAMCVAFFWSMFPYPVTEHSALRQDVAGTLYLLSKFNSIMDEVVRARLAGVNDLDNPKSKYYELHKARNKIFAKTALSLQGLRGHIALLHFEIPMGGRFPKEIYMKIIDRMQSLTVFITLVVLASKTFSEEYDPGELSDEKRAERDVWVKDFRRIVEQSTMTCRETTTLLSLLSASVASGNPLPPFLEPPKPYALVEKIKLVDPKMLTPEHIFEPGLTAFACLQIGTKCIIDDVAALLRDVKQLVGEIDFSFHTVSTTGSEESVVNSSKGSKQH